MCAVCRLQTLLRGDSCAVEESVLHFGWDDQGGLGFTWRCGASPCVCRGSPLGSAPVPVGIWAVLGSRASVPAGTRDPQSALSGRLADVTVNNMTVPVKFLFCS